MNQVAPVIAGAREAIERVAAALIERGELSGDEVDALIALHHR